MLPYVAETEGVNITEAGTAALLQLAGGDMRRVLNLLQATHLSYETVDEEVVYLTAGAAVPKVIEQMFNSLMTDPFETAYQTLYQVSLSEGWLINGNNILFIHIYSLDLSIQIYVCVISTNISLTNISIDFIACLN